MEEVQGDGVGGGVEVLLRCPPASASIDAAVVTVVAPSELCTSWLEVGVSDVFSEEMCEIMSSTEERETQSCIHSLTWYEAVSASERLKWAITASQSSGSGQCCWQRLRNICPVQCRVAMTLSHVQGTPGC